MTDKEKKALDIPEEKKIQYLKEYQDNNLFISYFIKNTIDGIPLCYQRPRFRSMRTKKGKMLGMMYNPLSKTENKLRKDLQKTTKKYEFLKEFLENPDIDYNIELYFDIYVDIPKNTSMKNIFLMESKKILPSNVKRKDIDNIVKCYMDIFTGVYYDDDCRVIDIHTHKYYSVNPRVEYILYFNKKTKNT